MAIISRAKQANKRGWDTTNKSRIEANKPKEELKKIEITEEEHKEKIEMLKKLGLIKE